MKLYCSHIWKDTFKTIVKSGGTVENLWIGNEEIPVRICDLCHVEWLKGDMMPPNVEIGHTKEDK